MPLALLFQNGLNLRAQEVPDLGTTSRVGYDKEMLVQEVQDGWIFLKQAFGQEVELFLRTKLFDLVLDVLHVLALDAFLLGSVRRSFNDRHLDLSGLEPQGWQWHC